MIRVSLCGGPRLVSLHLVFLTMREIRIDERNLQLRRAAKEKDLQRWTLRRAIDFEPAWKAKKFFGIDYYDDFA